MIPAIVGMSAEPPQGVHFEPSGVRRHIVKKERQRKFRGNVPDVFEQLRLAVWVVGGREHQGARARFRGETGKVFGLDEGRVGDADGSTGTRSATWRHTRSINSRRRR